MENIKAKNFKIFEVTKEFLKANDKEIIKGSLLIASIGLFIDLLFFFFGESIIGNIIGLIGLIGLIALITSIVLTFFLGMIIKVIAANWYFNNHKMNLKEAYDSLEGKKMVVFISDFIKAIKLILWTLLLIIPGICHIYLYIFNEDFVIFGNKEASESIKLSKEYAKTELNEVFIFGCIIGLIIILITSATSLFNNIFISIGFGIITPFISFCEQFIVGIASFGMAGGVTMKFIEICKERNINIKIGNKNLSDEDNKNGQIN